MYKITIIFIIYESNYLMWKDFNCSYTDDVVLLNRLQAIPASLNKLLLLL